MLREMVARGIFCIPVGCRSGGCGVCRIRVNTGTYELGRMSRAEISPEDEAAGVLLACQVRPTSDLEVTVLGKPFTATATAVAATKSCTHQGEEP